MDFSKYTINPGLTVKETIEIMNKNGMRFIFIIESNKLQGLFSYGDMRNYFLSGGDLNASITEAMNRSPIVFYSRAEAMEYHKKHNLITYPIVDRNNNLIDLWQPYRNNIVMSDCLSDMPLIIMAGGKGTRLYPYTKILPKALIPIGEKPISELIMESFAMYGCKDVHFVLNHKSGMIKSYFSDLDIPYNISYVEEQGFLGTGGGLALLKGSIKKTSVVTNCDILLQCDIECAYKTHRKNKNIITMICASKEVQIPYGIIENDAEGNICQINEKPEKSYLVNVGVYIIEPEVINDLKEGEAIDFPDIARKYMNEKKVGVFPISDNEWYDMGQISEMDDMIRKLELRH